MATPESKVLEKIVDRLKRLKAEGHPVWWVKYRADKYNRAGTPDLHITWYGFSVWVEAKAPGEEPTKIQKHTIAQINAAGGIAGAAECWGEVEEMLCRAKNALIPSR